jgi:hypothetical protein
MNKRTTAAIRVLGYGVAIAILACMLCLDDGGWQTLKLKYYLKWGTPVQKEAVLDLFMYDHRRAMVPAVINAITDDTRLPRHGDSGWGTVYHQAATAMSYFAQLVDGKPLTQRGLQSYSLHAEIGSASIERRQEVRRNWQRWYAENKKARMAYYPRLDASGQGQDTSREVHERRAELYARMGDHSAAQKEREYLRTRR